MKKLAFALLATGFLLSGCVYAPPRYYGPPPPGYGVPVPPPPPPYGYGYGYGYYGGCGCGR